MTPERYNTIRRVLDHRQPDLTVITDEVHKGRNLSAIVRTCDAVGVPRLHCVEPRKGYRAYRGTALGSHKWVEAQLHSSITSAVAEVKAQGFRVVAANLSERAVDYRQIDYTQPTALLLGTEKEGVSPDGLALADSEVIIPMVGMVESFNVSVAAAIILTEAQHQRRLAGLYQQCRLEDEEYQRLLFRWCQPVVTAYCDKNGLAYPALDEEGEIVEPAAWYQRVREQAV